MFRGTKILEDVADMTGETITNTGITEKKRIVAESLIYAIVHNNLKDNFIFISF